MSNTEGRQTACGFSGLAPDSYSQWRTSTVGAITERLERNLILGLVGDVQERLVLDVGCGDGDLAIDLAKRGAHVVGIDSSSVMIDAANQNSECNKVDVEFLVSRAQCLPFPAGQFDTVVAVTILCFIENPLPVFREMARILRPGGQLVIGELGKWSTWAAARRVRGWLGSRLWQKGRFRTPRELLSLARQAGLKAEPVQGAIFYPRLKLAARLLAPYDLSLGRITTFGAAFLALRAIKPEIQV